MAVTGSGKVVLFEDALHVPVVSCNIIFLCVLCKKGAQVVHQEGGNFLVLGEKCLVFNGFLENRLAFLNVNVLHEGNESIAVFSFGF